MGRFGNISKSVPPQGWQNHDACEVAGAVQGLKCRPSRSLNFNDNFSQHMALTLVNFQSPKWGLDEVGFWRVPVHPDSMFRSLEQLGLNLVCQGWMGAQYSCQTRGSHSLGAPVADRLIGRQLPWQHLGCHWLIQTVGMLKQCYWKSK